jgi:glutamate/tyrosine decarboxylase-like PLP-dependent enzyme
METNSKTKDVTLKEDRTLEALFLGPNGENSDLLSTFINQALESHKLGRRSFYPSDADHITPEIKASETYKKSKDTLQSKFTEVLEQLQKYSVPFFSNRHHGHFAYDPSIPSIIGYFAAMLYNPNNVTYEYSTICTEMEIAACAKICKMFGYEETEHPEKPTWGATKLASWGHITTDGTVANLESMWAARNAKFKSVGIQYALKTDKRLSKALDMKVKIITGESKLLSELHPWELLNMDQDEVLGLPWAMYQIVKGDISWNDLKKLLASHSLREIGIEKIYELMNASQKGIQASVFICPATRHYSIPKAAGVLGIGSSQLLEMPSDEDCRMDLGKLKETIQDCLDKRIPILHITCLLGTTEESAVDNIKGMFEMRDEFRKKGMNYHIHGDGAFGGYFASLLRKDPGIAGIVTELLDDSITFGRVTVPNIPLKEYVIEQLKHIQKLDSITIDPHKQGYTSYPAGCICFRNGQLKDLLRYCGDYIETHHGPQIGVFGIEGSKSGASAVSVFLAHEVTPLTRNHHGKLLASCIYACKRFYARLLHFERASKGRFVVIPIARLPGEIAGKSLEDVAKEKLKILDEIALQSDDEIVQKLKDPEFNKFFNEMGPDLNVLSYGVNFYDEKLGRMNQSLLHYDRFNSGLFNRFTPEKGKDIRKCKFICTHTILHENKYGDRLFKNYLSRAGLKDDTIEKEHEVVILRSAVMNPWLHETEKGTFLDVIEKDLLDVCEEVLAERPTWDLPKPEDVQREAGEA